MKKKITNVTTKSWTKTKLITVLACSAMFCLTLGSAATTVYYMVSKNEETVEKQQNHANRGEVDPVKNKLFENLTAADLELNSLVLRAKNLGQEGNNLTFAFTGGAQYLSFMKDYMGYDGATPDGSNTAASFGGRCDVEFDMNGKGNIKEQMKVFAKGDGKVYVEWNNTGYQISGNFINNAIAVVPEFASNIEGVDELVNSLLKIDILSLLPMVGTVGGSLCGENESEIDGIYKYSATIPAAVLGDSFEEDIILSLTCNASGELLDIELKEMAIPVDGLEAPIKVSLKTENLNMVSLSGEDALKMVAVNSEEGKTLNVNYEKFGVTTTSLDEFYNNSLDSTPNLAYTVAAMMKAKQVKMDMSLKFEEKEYNPNKAIEERIGDVALNDSKEIRREIKGYLGATIEDGFDTASYKFALEKTEDFNNSIEVTYQGKDTEDYKAGVYANVNGDIKAYLNTKDASEITLPMDELSPETAEAAASLVNANDILSNTVIGDIIDGNYSRYHDILNKIEFKTIEGYENILITVKAGGLNLNLQDYFAFEDTLITIRLRYKALELDEVKSTRITDISIENIPLAKRTTVNGTFLDTASLVLSLAGKDENSADYAYIFDSIPENNEERIVPLISKVELDSEYADLKPAINLVNDLIDITGDKKIKAQFDATYIPDGSANRYTVDGELKADFSRNFVTDGEKLVGNDYGSYEFALHGTVNQIDHNINLKYLPIENEDPQVFYTYNSYNDKYQTRLKVSSAKMVDLYGAIMTLLSSQDINSEIDTDELKDKAFSTVTDNLEKVLNLVDGDIWNILSEELPTQYIRINNLLDEETGNIDKNTLVVNVNSAIFGSDYSGNFITLALDTNNHEVMAVDADVTLPKTKDRIKFNFRLSEMDDADAIVTPNPAIYRSTDSTIDALIEIATGSFLNSFDFSGVLSNKRITPRG